MDVNMISTEQAKKNNLDLIYKLKTDIRLLREENKQIIHQFLTRDCSKDFRNIRDEIDNLVFLRPGQKAQLNNL